MVQGVDRIQRDIADVRERMTESARANASQEENVFASGEQVLRALANQPQVREGGPGCPRSLSDALKGLAYFTNIARVDAQGNVICAAVMPPQTQRNVASQQWWRPAARETGFFITPETFSPVAGRDVLRGVLPMHTANGAFDGAILLAFDVSWLDRLLHQRPLPPNAVLAVFDPAGMMVAASNQARAEAIFLRRPKAPQQEQLFSVDAFGRSWTDAIVPISSRGISVGFARPNGDLFSGTYIHVATDLLLPVFMFALASAAIWIATGRLITRWLDYLRRIAVAYGRGHYGVRPTALAAAPTEFKALGETISGMAGAIEDRDRRLRAALEQKSAMIKETHHRVKNNLQIVMSLLSLQAGKLRDPAAQQALRQAQFRVNALALVHRILYENDDLSAIDLKKLIEDLARQMHGAAGKPARDLQLEFDLVPRLVSSDMAVPLTLFVVEALTNAFRHAYPPESRGVVRLSLSPTGDGKLRLAVEDDGVGLNVPESETGIGSRLIQAFARQVGGTPSVRQREPAGTVVELIFNDPENSGSDRSNWAAANQSHAVHAQHAAQ